MKNRTAVNGAAVVETPKLTMVQLWDKHGLWQDECGQFYTGKCRDHNEEAQPIGKVRPASVVEAARWYVRWSPADVSEDGAGSANPILQALLRRVSYPPVVKITIPTDLNAN